MRGLIDLCDYVAVLPYFRLWFWGADLGAFLGAGT